MSSFNISKEILQPKLRLCSQICSKKDPVEVYTHLKLEIKSGILFISALNSMAFYSTNVIVSNSTSDCVFAIKADTFSQAVDLIDVDDIKMEYDQEKNTILIKGKKAKHTLRTNNDLVSEFVQPESSNEALVSSVKIQPDTLVNAIKSTFIAVGDPKSTYQPEFTNICFTIHDSEKKLVVVSTDRFRVLKNTLTDMTIESNNSSEKYDENKMNFLLPPKSLKLTLAAIDQQEGEVKIEFNNDFAWFKLADSTIILSYGQGNYPDYNRIFPESFACSFVVNSKDFIASLKQVSLVGSQDTTNKKVKLTVSPEDKQITFVSDNKDGESSESFVAIDDYQGHDGEWEQYFNSSYLSDYLSIADEKVLIESNPNKPAVLSNQGKRDSQIYLVSGLK